MKKLKAVISKGPEDYGAWLENLDGVYGAGETTEAAKNDLIGGLELYSKHNSNAPSWIREKEYELVFVLEE